MYNSDSLDQLPGGTAVFPPSGKGKALVHRFAGIHPGFYRHHGKKYSLAGVDDGFVILDLVSARGEQLSVRVAAFMDLLGAGVISKID
jgi:hypothetical protein